MAIERWANLELLIGQVEGVRLGRKGDLVNHRRVDRTGGDLVREHEREQTGKAFQVGQPGDQRIKKSP